MQKFSYFDPITEETSGCRSYAILPDQIVRCYNLTVGEFPHRRSMRFFLRSITLLRPDESNFAAFSFPKSMAFVECTVNFYSKHLVFRYSTHPVAVIEHTTHFGNDVSSRAVENKIVSSAFSSWHILAWETASYDYASDCSASAAASSQAAFCSPVFWLCVVYKLHSIDFKTQCTICGHEDISSNKIIFPR